MYTWAYLKAAAFAKLDLTEDEATAQNLTGRFYIYANEVITQVCSAVKPKHKFETFVVKKDNNGISHTTIQSSLNVDLHMNELEEMYNEIKI